MAAAPGRARSLSLAVGPPTLVDRLVPRGLVTDLFVVAAGAALTSVLSYVDVVLTPVPVSGQALAALLVGSLLGATRAAVAMLVFLALGIGGFPVFADGASGLEHLTGPLGGYLWGIAIAAILLGWVAQWAPLQNPRTVFFAFIGGGTVVFIVGAPWLAVSTGIGAAQAITEGVLPFLTAAAVSAGVASLALTAGWRLAHVRDRRTAASEVRS